MDKNIDYVIAIAECGSVSKAAEILYISQPSLSRYISRLENEIGVKLFVRGISGVTLTEAGKVYVEYAKEIHCLGSSLKKKMNEFRMRETVTEIRIGTTMMTYSYLTGEVEATLSNEYPGCRVFFENVLSKNLEELMESGTVNFSLGPDICNHSQFDYRILQTYSYVLLVPVRYDFSKYTCGISKENYPVLNLKELAPFDLVLQEKHTNVRKEIDNVLSDCGIQVNSKIDLVNSQMVVQAVERQLGCCIIPESFLHFVSKPETLNVYELALDIKSYHGLIMKRGKILSAPEAAIIKILADMVNKEIRQLRNIFTAK